MREYTALLGSPPSQWHYPGCENISRTMAATLLMYFDQPALATFLILSRPLKICS